jgi:hypothetical protein
LALSRTNPKRDNQYQQEKFALQLKVGEQEYASLCNADLGFSISVGWSQNRLIEDRLPCVTPSADKNSLTFPQKKM